MKNLGRQPLKVLCVDLEGGHGGSSRSLYFALRELPAQGIEPLVVCRRGGRIEQLYAEAGIDCVVEPALPAVSSLARLSRNILTYGNALRRWPAARPALKRVRALAEQCALVHFNHEGLFLTARWLRRRLTLPLTMHIRTNLCNTVFARWQLRTISRTVDACVFITENERTRFERLGGTARGPVIYNPVPPFESEATHPAIVLDDRLRVACLSNYSFARGIDRLVDIAASLDAKRRSRLQFVVAGDMDISKTERRRLGLRHTQNQLCDLAVKRGVDGCFTFLGHVAVPEQVLSACHVVLKPTREANPWGRDILEAMAAAKPVYSIGLFDRFVQTGATGLLQPDFDAAAVAAWLTELERDRNWLAQLGNNAREQVMALCAAPHSAAALVRFWRDTLAAAPTAG